MNSFLSLPHALGSPLSGRSDDTLSALDGMRHVIVSQGPEIRIPKFDDPTADVEAGMYEPVNM